MDFAIILLLQIAIAIATIILFSIGLAVVFGMMRVINLAHGEFIMLGAYGALKSYEAGLNLWVGMLIVAPLVSAIYGLVVERILIRRLYGRLIDTLLATWGLSLFTVGMVTMIFGNTAGSVPTPLSTLQIGQYGLGIYNLFIIAITAVVLLVIYLVLKHTNFGTLARGTMQDADMVAAIGYNPKTVYAATFAVGAALAGLAGGLLAPVTGIIPTMGAAFVAKAFITVISGGAAIILGTGATAAIFGAINQIITFVSTPVLGEAALLLAAILLLRMLPNGLSGRFFKGGL
ncbi:ABC transporter permease subunit [Agrobacterium rosae]|uniref:Branched-chain amino acid ABC transporter permease n=1 Tax=Agrobacterium rosae TaxID=1972867 RepID=A0AAW9FLT7_9HYPH|nr:branched-chain amino acid ABC transporter permease [Agrobacterium rosae]MDX8304454.1 branched-chain amino acid ABC transporter permease [Agrobacterium rosae]